MQAAASKLYGCSTSVNAKAIASISPLKLKGLSKQLSEVSGAGGRVVLSYEGWINDSEIFNKSRILSKSKVKSEVICYIRPPVEWINSAWWQWGAWAEVPFQYWINGTLRYACWYDRVMAWNEVDGVEKVTVHLLPKDIVSDFCQILGIPPIQTSRSNAGLPASVLRLYQKSKQLRSGPHNSAIDFMLAHYLKESGDPALWVLGPKLIDKMIFRTRESNLKLLEMLRKEPRVEMEHDA